MSDRYPTTRLHALCRLLESEGHMTPVATMQILAAGHLLTPHPRWKCEMCGYPDDDANGKYWRCSMCAYEDYEPNGQSK